MLSMLAVDFEYRRVKNRPMLTGPQCRAARALLGLKRKELAEVSGVPLSTLADLESGRHTPHASTVAALVRYFQQSGLTLLWSNDEHGVGVCFKKGWPK